MTKTSKPASTGKRLFKQLGLGALAGAIIGFAVGAYMDKLSKWTVDVFLISDYLAFLTLLLSIVLVLVTAYYLYQTKRSYQLCEATTDDDESEEVYRQLAKAHAYAMTYSSVSTVLIIMHLLFSYRFILRENGLFFNVPILGFVLIIVVAVLQMVMMKWYNKIRHIKAPLLPSLKELKNNILEQDEAELQANYKMSFEIVMNLSNLIIPLIYLLLFAQAGLFQTVNLTAIIAVTGIHLYIMLMQFKMIKQFYR